MAQKLMNKKIDLAITFSFGEYPRTAGPYREGNAGSVQNRPLAHISKKV